MKLEKKLLTCGLGLACLATTLLPSPKSSYEEMAREIKDASPVVYKGISVDDIAYTLDGMNIKEVKEASRYIPLR